MAGPYTIAVKDALQQTQTINTVPPVGAATAANSLPVSLATDLANLEPAGVPITGAAMPTAGVGLTGWLSAIWKSLSGQLPASLGAKAGAASLSVVPNSDTVFPISAASLPLPAGAAAASGLTTINTTLGAPLQAGGAVSVSNLPATQAISAVSLPLPAGAATATGVAGVVTALGTPLQAGGAVSVSNLPATQAVSAAALPLPTGASTASGVASIVTALGAPMQAGGTVTANLGTLNGAATAAGVATINTTLGTPFQAGASIGNIAFGISGTLPAFASTPTVNIGTAPTIAVTGTFYQATQPVSGSVTVTSLGSPFQAGGAIANTVFGATQSGTWNIANVSGTVSLPTGASTETTLVAASAKLPASLGIKTAANSLSIAPASDAQFSTLADTLARTVTSDIITRQANVVQYTAGQLVGGSATAGFTSNGLTFANTSRVTGGVVQINRIRLYKSNPTALGTFEVRFYRAQPTITIGDAGAVSTGTPVGNSASATRLVGRATFDMTTAAVGSDGAELAALPITGTPILASLPSGASSLFAVIVATAAYTPASGETFSIVLEGYSF